jgi:hypothetical protein
LTPHLKLQTTIEDDEHPIEIPIDIEVGVSQVLIRVSGYGNNAVEDAPVVAVQIYDGGLQVLIWDDVNNPEPAVHLLEGAREDNNCT